VAFLYCTGAAPIDPMVTVINCLNLSHCVVKATQYKILAISEQCLCVIKHLATLFQVFLLNLKLIN
jgi:hypothetical protein